VRELPRPAREGLGTRSRQVAETVSEGGPLLGVIGLSRCPVAGGLVCHEDCHLERERHPAPGRRRCWTGWGPHSRDVACLQEIKAAPDQIPPSLWDLDDYWTWWHGAADTRAWRSSSASRSRPSGPLVVHPAFDFENRMACAEVGGVTVASVYVPNGGKDLLRR